jgi:hypothetical protein
LNFPGNTMVGDLAVLKLAGAAAVPPVLLPAQAAVGSPPPPGSLLHLAGFGQRNPSAVGPTRRGVLRATPLRSRSCDDLPDFDPASMLCAAGSRIPVQIDGRGRKPVARSGCFGDSGGPLIERTQAGPRVAGVLSYGQVIPRRSNEVACGLKGLPDVYTRVDSGLAFIQANL